MSVSYFIFWRAEEIWGIFFVVVTIQLSRWSLRTAHRTVSLSHFDADVWLAERGHWIRRNKIFLYYDSEIEGNLQEERKKSYYLNKGRVWPAREMKGVDSKSPCCRGGAATGRASPGVLSVCSPAPRKTFFFLVYLGYMHNFLSPFFHSYSSIICRNKERNSSGGGGPYIYIIRADLGLCWNRVFLLLLLLLFLKKKKIEKKIILISFLLVSGRVLERGGWTIMQNRRTKELSFPSSL